MILALLGTLLLSGLLAGCGGGPGAGLGKVEQFKPELAETLAPETEDSLTEELTPKRLDELYAKTGIPGWDSALEEELKKWEQQLQFDVPIQTNRQVRAYLVYFSTERKEIIRRYLARSSRYLPLIKEIFQENGLPEDLAYLAMVESGFNPHAYSRAHACGMWQFIKGTGLRYGLAIDSYVDERRDPEKSTRAAAKYLLDLYKQFGSWYLAAASYNCGEGRVQRELDQSSHKNFWDLSDHQCLPNETKNYVPQMIAATIIAKNPEKFGFKNVPYLPPLKYERVKVDEPTSLKATAVAINVPLEEIQMLNPELRRGITPPDTPSYTLNLPLGSTELFARNIFLARLEHPAVAERAPRVARGTSRGSSPGKASSRGHGGGKSTRKSKTVATKGKTRQPAQIAYAYKGKTSPAPQAANILGNSGQTSKATSRDGAKNKGSASGTSKGKAKSQTKKGSKKPDEVRLIKKDKLSKSSLPQKSKGQLAGKKTATSSRRPKMVGSASPARGKWARETGAGLTAAR
jgi:membrane-bound lytic murein transglycosylase D